MAGQVYLVRVVFSLMSVLLVAVNDASCLHQAGAHGFLILAGLLYPHLGHLFLGRFDADLRHGHVLFLLDGFFTGAVIGALEFAWLPSSVLLVICLFNWMIVGGIPLTGSGLALLVAGALLTGSLPATLASIPSGCPASLWSAAALFATYFLIVAQVIHRLIGTLQRQQTLLQANSDAANEACSRAEQALLSAFPRSVASQLETTGKHSPERLPSADLLLIELDGFASPPGDLGALQQSWQECDAILTRHGIELIKTCGSRAIALGRDPSGLAALVDAAREILSHFSDHGGQPGSEHVQPRRVLIHRGAVTLGLVQPERLNLDLTGPGIEALLALAMETKDLAPEGLIVSPAALRHLRDTAGFLPLPAEADTPLCHFARIDSTR